MLRRITLALAVLLGIGSPLALAEAVSIRVAGWNMESGESSQTLLEQQLAAKQGVDIWGLCEVENRDALMAFEAGAEEGENGDFKAILGATGGADRLAILYDTGVVDLLGSEELTAMTLGRSGLRAPLVAHFKGKRTSQEFKFMVNHLARGDAQARLEQSEMLNEWARAQFLPVIAVCDYSYDYHVSFGDQGRRDAGFDAITGDGTFIWVRPERLVKTQASDRYMTVLDFIFVANLPLGWTGESRILKRAGDAPAVTMDFNDSAQATDHRPVDATFTFLGEADPSADPDDDAPELMGKATILKRRLDLSEKAIRRLRAIVSGWTIQ